MGFSIPNQFFHFGKGRFVMFSAFGFQNYGGVYSIVRQPRFRVVTMLASLALLSWGLWGESAPHYWEALAGNLREGLKGFVTNEMRLDVTKREIDASRDETEKRAQAKGELDAEIAAVDQIIERLLASEEQDKMLLDGLRNHLSSSGADETVRIHGKTFSRCDLEREATVILERCHARRDEINDQRNRRNGLDEHRQKMLTALRERISRTRKAEMELDRARRQSEQMKLDEQLIASNARPANGDALSRAEVYVAELNRELVRKKAGKAVLNEITYGNPTPVAQEIQRELNPPKSIVARIDEILQNLFFSPARPPKCGRAAFAFSNELKSKETTQCRYPFDG